MHMLLILLALCLRKPNGISHLFSIAYAFAGNGWTATPALRDPFLAERQLSCCQDVRFAQPLPIPYEACIGARLAEHSFEQPVINRAEVVGDIQINDGLNLLLCE